MEIFVLGANDNEMHLIVEILQEQNRPFVFALAATEDRRANPAECARGEWRAEIPEGVERVVLVELTPNSSVDGYEVIIIDHHTPQHPPFPSLHQVAAYLLGGERALIMGACDHDLARAYSYFPPEKVLRYRAEAIGASLEEAERYYERLQTTRIPNLLLGVEKSPNPLVGDVLIAKGKAGLINVGPQTGDKRARFVVTGATTPELVEQVLRPFRERGFETYATRAIGGVYVDNPVIVPDILNE